MFYWIVYVTEDLFTYFDMLLVSIKEVESMSTEILFTFTEISLKYV